MVQPKEKAWVSELGALAIWRLARVAVCASTNLASDVLALPDTPMTTQRVVFATLLMEYQKRSHQSLLFLFQIQQSMVWPRSEYGSRVSSWIGSIGSCAQDRASFV